VQKADPSATVNQNNQPGQTAKQALTSAQTAMSGAQSVTQNAPTQTNTQK
jgi:hypothetical protein